MQRLLCLAVAVLLANQAAAQLFGGNPPSLKWQQVNTDTVRVIFPYGMETQGRRVADLVRHMSRYNTGSLGPRVKKINIILQHQTLQSNGYVQVGPFRSEFLHHTAAEQHRPRFHQLAGPAGAARIQARGAEQ